MFKLRNILKPSLLFSFILALVIFTSCGKKDTDQKTDNNKMDDVAVAPVDTSGAASGDWVVIREIADPEKMNPIVSNDASAAEYQSYIYESLLNQDKISYDLVPWLADLPEIAPDFSTYTFHMKKNVTFSDGTPLTGEDVVFSLKLIKVPFIDDAPLRNYYEPVQKVELVNGDPFTLKFTMLKPSWRGIYYLGTFPIMPKHVLDPQGVMDKVTWDELKDFNSASKNPGLQKYSDFINSQEVSRQAKYLIGSGPYIFEKWETGQGVTLKKNPNYWDVAQIPNYPNKLIFKTIQDNSAALVSAKNKEVDAMFVIPPLDFYKNLDNPDQFKLIKARPSEPSYNYIAWNELNPLFQDKNVRMALSMLIDRKTIIDKILYGDAVMIQSDVFYQNKKLLNTDLPVINYDVDKAKELLTASGWKDSDGDGVLDKVINGKKTDFKFTFLIYNNPVRKQILLVIIEALKKAGIAADLQEIEWSVYLDKTKKHEFDATYSAWTSPTTPPDPYQIWHSSQSKGEGRNYISFNNPVSDSLIMAYKNEMDEAKRIDILKKWQKVIYDDQPYTFLWSGKSRYIYDARFKNARWYNIQPSPSYNEWWVPKPSQKYTQNMNN